MQYLVLLQGQEVGQQDCVSRLERAEMVTGTIRKLGAGGELAPISNISLRPILNALMY